MLNNNQLEIITTSIEAAIQPDLWHKTLDLLIDSYNGLSGNISVMDENHESRLAIAMSRFIREDAYEMYEKFMRSEDADDAVALAKVFRLPENKITSEYDFFGVQSYDELPHSSFRDWQRDKFDIAHRNCMKLNTHGPWLDILIIHTDSKKGRLLPNEIIKINQLSKVMSSSIKSFRVMEQLRRQFNATLNALNNLGIACFLTINSALVIHRNSVAKDLLDDNDGLNIDHAGNLSSTDENLSQIINKSCYDSFQTAHAKNISSEILLSLERPSGKPPYLFIINPIIDANAEFEIGLRCALVFVVDPATTKNLSVDGLIKLGNLTQAEAVICEMLVQGLTTEQIMDRRNVSENTIRKQIKIILGKLNCNSRIDLLRMAIDTRLPIN
jgi:DNA-binding CsgD family transcriptional regulator